MMKLLTFISSCLLLLSATAFTPNTNAADDQITSLPGIADEDVTFNHYAGYLSVDNTTNAYIFYWFVESQNDPANDPVVLWSNGGPGCSGLIGFMTEHGPFRPQSDLSLELNEYSWNKVANMLYVESPPGVGFSYAEDTSAYDVNDSDTANYNYQAILSFLEKFPQYRTNEFHISAESYGGHYIPELALKIVTANANQENPDNIINFKGFAVGNPFTSQIDNFYGAVETYWGHQIISYPTYSSWKDACFDQKRINECLLLEAKMYKEMGNLNPYALDYPVCNAALVSQRIALLKHITPEHLKPFVRLDREAYEPCTDNWSADYLNQESVQEAIHAQATNWSECSDTINYSFLDEFLPIEPIYHALARGNYGIKMFVYSGDDDTVCATIGTQLWMYRLGFKELTSWETWTYTDPVYGDQIGGYYVEWEGISLATVRGAGHEVPTYKPVAALKLFENYLNGVF